MSTNATNTKVTYMWRDEDNWKTYAEAVLTGTISDTEREQLLEAVPIGEDFNPEQVGLELPEGWNVYPGQCELVSIEHTDEKPDDERTISAFVQEVTAVEMWHDLNYEPKPIVVVIENPEGDPDTYVIGDVELIELSSYPATQWMNQDRVDNPEYPGDMRKLADRVQNMPGRAPLLAVHLRHLADEYDRRAAEKG